MMARIAQRGFSLVELMIVLAIVGILAAIAVPQYQLYTQRSRVSASLAAARPLQLAVAEYAADKGELPPSSAALADYGAELNGTAYASGLVAAVEYSAADSSAAITIRYQSDTATPAAIRGHSLVIAPTLGSVGQLRFTISGTSSLPAKLRPRL